jgi:hypothetical protein
VERLLGWTLNEKQSEKMRRGEKKRELKKKREMR